MVRRGGNQRQGQGQNHFTRQFKMKWIFLLVCTRVLGCQPIQSRVMVAEEEVISSWDVSSIGLPKLSDYHFFKGDLKNSRERRTLNGL